MAFRVPQCYYNVTFYKVGENVAEFWVCYNDKESADKALTNYIRQSNAGCAVVRLPKDAAGAYHAVPTSPSRFVSITTEYR